METQLLRQGNPEGDSAPVYEKAVHQRRTKMQTSPTPQSKQGRVATMTLRPASLQTHLLTAAFAHRIPESSAKATRSAHGAS